ncbi:hypothetical protein GDO81_005874 [Engystomops pustulosus]|uniref:Uncharacterized protein n=1 Tax=Engystomops pustulosus TaxID=76066 RepID=A0AAV7CSM4_ENGPU|nr:hypothetical protein GDO81_005874 [Engystomops pustulosus]
MSQPSLTTCGYIRRTNACASALYTPTPSITSIITAHAPLPWGRKIPSAHAHSRPCIRARTSARTVYIQSARQRAPILQLQLILPGAAICKYLNPYSPFIYFIFCSLILDTYSLYITNTLTFLFNHCFIICVPSLTGV